jgi:hypothetical protein
VYRTSNNGLAWEDISGNLPDFPVNKIVIDPVIPGTYYIGTDGGVFITRNRGVSWEIYGTGLPRVPVFDLYLHAPTRMLTAATFGRSMFTIPLPATEGTNPIISNLSQIKAFPNPFSSAVTISFTADRNLDGELAVFDLAGKQIKVLHKGMFTMGENLFTWTGDAAGGNPGAPGMYLVRLVTGSSVSAVRVQKF